jgi:hypothetical protein
VGLVDDEQRAHPVAGLPHGEVPAVVGQHDADVGERRLDEDGRHLAAGQRGLERRDVVERHDDGRLAERHGRSDAPPARDHPAVVAEGRVRLVDGAVVAVVDHEHLPASRRLPRIAEGVPVGIRRREGELPLVQAEPLGEHRRRLGGVGCRQHRRRAAPQLRRDGLHGGGGRVADHRPGVAEAEIDVVDAVQVGEVRAGRGLDEDRPRTGPLAHPEHRHAARQVPSRSPPRLLGRGALPPEAADLLVGERGEALPVGVHAQPSRASLRRRAPAASCWPTTSTIASRKMIDANTLACAGIARAAAV